MPRVNDDRLLRASRPSSDVFLPASEGSGEAGKANRGGSAEASLPPSPPRTELGRKLWDTRRRVVASGAQLLDWDQIEEELAARRGERA